MTSPETWPPLAEAFARQAWPFYSAGLAIVGMATAGVAGLLRGPMSRHARRWRPDSGPLIGSVAIGFLAVLGAAALFTELAEQIGPPEGLEDAVGRSSVAHLDEVLAQALRQHLGAGAMQGFAFLTHLGDGGFLTALCVAVAALLLAQKRHGLAVAWLAALGGNALLTPMLKHIFERVRPVHLPGLVEEPSWSFPSGHASSSAVAYGMLAYLALVLLPSRWHVPAMVVAASTVYTVGCSRVMLQVHYASDVLAGWASGTVWLAVCVASAEFSRRRMGRKRSGAG